MKISLAAPLLAMTLPAAAGGLPDLSTLSQEQFRGLSEDLGAAFSYKGVTPATALGPWGLDLGLELSATNVKNGEAFKKAGNDTDNLFIPKLHVNKGLWAGFDIGGFVGGSSDLSASVLGLELRYAFVQDSVTSPAVAMRVSGTRTDDIGDLRMQTYGVDLMLSKRFALATPYIGIGALRIESNAGASGLADENFSKGRLFGGLNFNLALINFAVEAERLGDNTTLSGKVGWRF
jgi:hypothetical protein